MTTDNFHLIEYKRIPIKADDHWLMQTIKVELNTTNCYKHYAGKLDKASCRCKEGLIAAAEVTGVNAHEVIGTADFVAQLADEIQGNK